MFHRPIALDAVHCIGRAGFKTIATPTGPMRPMQSCRAGASTLAALLMLTVAAQFGGLPLLLAVLTAVLAMGSAFGDGATAGWMGTFL
jgi:hypothetical protein